MIKYALTIVLTAFLAFWFTAGTVQVVRSQQAHVVGYIAAIDK